MPRFTAVIHDAHDVRFVAAADSQRELAAQVVAYIRERCDYVLWPRVAATVRAFLTQDETHAAIATYFANVGQRWDAERLEVLDFEPAAAIGNLPHSQVRANRFRAW